MGPGNIGPAGGRDLQRPPNPTRELEQVITEVITARL
jgi:hypothetical protein